MVEITFFLILNQIKNCFIELFGNARRRKILGTVSSLR
jgi:hypothetical protein